MSKKKDNKAPEGHPKSRKEDSKSKPQTEEQRQATRNKKPFFRNYDYTQEGPNETSPGGGLYHGPMNKYKSVKDFTEKRKKDKKAEIYLRINKLSSLFESYK